MTDMSSEPLEVYFSHSWRPEDVAFNLLIWDAIADQTCLSVDRQGGLLKADAFYVNRIEHLIRQSDTFVSALPFRENTGANGSGTSEFQLRCSQPSLFELRLAERARKPRLVIYDSKTRFRPTGTDSEFVKYVAVDAQREIDRGGPLIRAAAASWLTNVSRRRESGLMPTRNEASINIDEDTPGKSETLRAILSGLESGRFTKHHTIESHHLDSDIMAMLQASDLLILDVGTSDSSVLGLAHALFIPTIRFAMAGHNRRLPSLLSGHPYGYEQDIIMVDQPDNLAAAIMDRVASMEETRNLINTKDGGRVYFQSKMVRPHKVFISHNATGALAGMIDHTVALLSDASITAWEYRDQLSAGVKWREKLATAMADTTHVIFIADQNFESSSACWDELMYFSQEKRLKEGKVFPYFWGSRTRPLAAYAHLDHKPLPLEPEQAAKIVADRIIQELRDTHKS